MPLDTARTRRYLDAFDFKTLFVEELGWNRAPGRPLDIAIEGTTYRLQPVAEKAGFQVFECAPDDQGHIPARQVGLKIERELAKLVFEHLIIFGDAGRTEQRWQWVRREPGRPTTPREETYRRGQSGERLAQKLAALEVTFADEEQGVVIGDVTRRARGAFDLERVTKKFYDRFKSEHTAFAKFLSGIPDDDLARWYVSVMLNRLMFIYFIQKKGFLDGDGDYLRRKLAASMTGGKDRFYHDFLTRLFFEGFASKEAERSPAARQLLGRVPYLNGGLFTPHQIEELHGKTIQIGDAAFEKLFAFFEEYNWHLDDRPLRDDKEINPDVLGYIFEKYINQKQMGAYYTKEDITGYIAQNTIIPYLFDAAAGDCAIAFRPDGAVWGLLREQPDRYFYKLVPPDVPPPAVPKGMDLPLPPAIAAGLDDVTRREGWNRPADAAYALPTETWREHVARRQRYEEVRTKLAAGEVHRINDLITYNLDIRQFAQDAVAGSEGPELLRAFYKAIRGVTVLDPTCGSGAFLFAALGVLYPLYDACLERMEGLVRDADAVDQKQKYPDFRATLAEIGQHPNRAYFILKSIIVNNLYGVDIMEEAVEIAKLRLFLKLVAQVETVAAVEPLPDIDFNIRAGNTLVGFATREAVREAITTQGGQKRLMFAEDTATLQRIEETATDLDRLFTHFRAQQTTHGGHVTPDDKAALRARAAALEDELNRYLADEYGVDPQNKAAFKKWQESHQPFHWFVDFYGIMKRGGFDVILGNPPWKEYSAVRKTYTIQGYVTEDCGNLHAICTERGLALRSSNGWLSFIVQLPMVSSSRMNPVRTLVRERSRALFVATFDDRPGKLFEGLQNCRSVIFLSQAQGQTKAALVATTGYLRWPTNTRSLLFPQLIYTPVLGEPVIPGQFPKYSSEAEESAFRKVKSSSQRSIGAALSRGPTDHFIFYQEATRYWVKANIGLPYYAKNGIVGAPAHGRFLYFDQLETAQATCALLNSSLFYAYFVAYSDCFHLSDGLVVGFPVTSDLLEDPLLCNLSIHLMQDLHTNAEIKTIRTSDGAVITYAEYYASKSKPIIDEMDRVLAQHYGFTPEELDFIINYDIKYRMGRDAEAEDDAADGSPGAQLALPAAPAAAPASSTARATPVRPATPATPPARPDPPSPFATLAPERPAQLSLETRPRQAALGDATPPPPLRPGDRVRHATFGTGQVLAVTPDGADQVVTVQFATGGKKQLKASLAKLERV